MTVAESIEPQHKVRLGGSFPSLFRFRPHPAVRDLGITASTSFFVALAAMIVISLLGKKLGPALLGEYLLVRRVASWLQAGVQVSSGIALPRYVARSLDAQRATRQAYFLSALLTGSAIAISLAAILITYKTSLSQWVFGSAQMGYLAMPLGILLLGLAAHIGVFGYYQGAIAMRRACALQLVNLVCVPILVTLFLWRTHSIALLVDGIGLAMILGAVVFGLPILRKLDFGAVAKQFWQRASELFSYGIVRIPGDFGIQALLSLPAIIAAHYLPMKSVAFLLLGGSFLAVVSAATLPLGIILLSRVSKSLAEDQTSKLRVQVSYLVTALIELPAFVCLQMIVFSDVIVRIWVGPSFSEGIRVVQIVILAVPFFFFATGLSSVVDAASIKAYNARNILISLGAFLLLVGILKTAFPPENLLEGLAGATVAGLAILAILTYGVVRRLYSVTVKWMQVLPGLSTAVILGLVSFALHTWVHFEPGIVLLLIFELLVTGIFILALKQFGSPWMPFLLDAMFLRTF